MSANQKQNRTINTYINQIHKTEIRSHEIRSITKYLGYENKQTHKTSRTKYRPKTHPTTKLLLNQIKHNLKYQNNLPSHPLLWG